MWGAVRTEVRRRLAAQRALLRHVLQNRQRFERQTGNPVTNICIWQTSAAPTATVHSDPGSGGSVNINPGVQGASPTAGANRVTLSVDCSGLALLTLRTHHVFRTTAPYDGILSVTAFFAPVGSYSLTGSGNCFGSPGLAILDLRARVKVRLQNAAGDTFRTPTPAYSLIVHDQTDAGCEADARVGAFNLEGDAFEASRPRVMNVAAGDEIIAKAQYNLLLMTLTLHGASGADADLDLSSADHGLNVPLVLVTVES